MPCRATSALRLTFQVPKELRDYIELLPKTAYIQAESQFSAQLKFLPRAAMLLDASAYFDKKSGQLDAPIMIRVADQVINEHLNHQPIIVNPSIKALVKFLSLKRGGKKNSTTQKTFQVLTLKSDLRRCP